MKGRTATSAGRPRVAKRPAGKVVKSSPRKRVHKPAYEVVGKTYDGVSILRPKARAKHFTSKQIREAIIEVVNAASD